MTVGSSIDDVRSSQIEGNWNFDGQTRFITNEDIYGVNSHKVFLFKDNVVTHITYEASAGYYNHNKWRMGEFYSSENRGDFELRGKICDTQGLINTLVTEKGKPIREPRSTYSEDKKTSGRCSYSNVETTTTTFTFPHENINHMNFKIVYESHNRVRGCIEDRVMTEVSGSTCTRVITINNPN